MKRFVITGHRAATTGDFKLDDIAGGAGRLDVLVRCVNSALFLSHGIRRDTECWLVLEGGDDAPKTVVFRGESVRYLNPDERSTASLIRNALMKPLPDGEEVQSSPGVSIVRMGFEDVLDLLSEDGSIIYLRENGTDCRDYEFPSSPVFVLGDDRDPTDEEEAALLSHDPDRIRLGPLSLHANHCITVVHNEIDRKGVRGWQSLLLRGYRSTVIARTAGRRSSERADSAPTRAGRRRATRSEGSSGSWGSSGSR